ncbi:hypothetical protein EPN87_00460 [archaeon]|nr:MAG: hypothetical protein EPN87_00460 [archaeon]
MRLFVREEYGSKLTEKLNIQLSPYQERLGILTGELVKSGHLSKLDGSFVRARHSIWIPEESTQQYHAAKITNSPAYVKTIVYLTSYNQTNVHYHLHKKTMSEMNTGKKDVVEVELTGGDDMPAIENIFGTYYDSPLVRKINEMCKCLVVYESDEFLQRFGQDAGQMPTISS